MDSLTLICLPSWLAGKGKERPKVTDEYSAEGRVPTDPPIARTHSQLTYQYETIQSNGPMRKKVQNYNTYVTVCCPVAFHHINFINIKQK